MNTMETHMQGSVAAQRAARLFWSVVGGSLLVVGGLLLAWLLGSRSHPPLPLLDACLRMMRQVWGSALQQVALLSIAPVLMLGLMVSGVWAMGRSLMAWWRTRRLVLSSTPYSPGRWSTLDVALATLPPGQWRLRTLSTVRPVACTVGLWRPQILLSTGLMGMLTPTELGAVVAHEWGHIRQRDPLRITLLRFWSTALWFVPIIRRLARDSVRAMEEAADDAAVSLTAQPLELAAALVKTAKAQSQRHRMPVPALGGEQVVTERVERLLALAPPCPPRGRLWTWTASAGMTVCLLGLLILPRQPVVVAMASQLFGLQPTMVTCRTNT